MRRDGSSVFGENNKYAVFPAVSASWRISQEDFMQGTPFSELRLRAGYGLQGNQAIAPFNSLILLGADPGVRYQFGSTVVTGVTPSQNANPDLKWETTRSLNFGIDLGLFDERVITTLDISLPDIDGFEVARRIRTFSSTYLVMLTGRAEEIDTLLGLDAGADDYVTKPFGLAELKIDVAGGDREAALVEVFRSRRCEGYIIATDTPTGSGVMPLGMLYTIAHLASLTCPPGRPGP